MNKCKSENANCKLQNANWKMSVPGEHRFSEHPFVSGMFRIVSKTGTIHNNQNCQTIYPYCRNCVSNSHNLTQFDTIQNCFKIRHNFRSRIVKHLTIKHLIIKHLTVARTTINHLIVKHLIVNYATIKHLTTFPVLRLCGVLLFLYLFFCVFRLSSFA